MKQKLKALFYNLFTISLPVFVVTFLPQLASAHENYVLTKGEVDADLAYRGASVFNSLRDPANLRIGLTVAIFSTLGIILYFFFQHSETGQKFERAINKLEGLGHVILRAALGASLIASANFNAFLGPEIPLSSIPLGIFFKYAMYILGVLLILGLWAEIVGAISLAFLFLSTVIYKDYMVTYFNYFGEFIALILYGSRIFSLDKIIFKAKEWAEKHKDWEVPLIRITYGISIMYPAITYKLLHPEIIVDIAHRYNLTQFHWLFPNDPLLIALGTGLAQIAVGICLIIGFETRLNTFITFTLMVMSVLFFKEAVWPHFILLALALYLMINNGGKYSVDNYVETNKQKLKQQFKQYFLKRVA